MVGKVNAKKIGLTPIPIVIMGSRAFINEPNSSFQGMDLDVWVDLWSNMKKIDEHKC